MSEKIKIANKKKEKKNETTSAPDSKQRTKKINLFWIPELPTVFTSLKVLQQQFEIWNHKDITEVKAFLLPTADPVTAYDLP